MRWAGRAQAVTGLGFSSGCETCGKLLISWVFISAKWEGNRDYYSALKRRAFLTHATTRTNLEGITLSEVSQSRQHTQTDTVWLLSYEVPRRVKSAET